MLVVLCFRTVNKPREDRPAIVAKSHPQWLAHMRRIPSRQREDGSIRDFWSGSTTQNDATVRGNTLDRTMHSNPLEVVRLTPLMEHSSGRPEVKVALIDGPVLLSHPDLVQEHIQEIPGTVSGSCSQATSEACMHGTFVAGMLAAKRSSPAPAICPDCTLLVRPIFAEAVARRAEGPSATPEELGAAIMEAIDAGARIINMSAALAQPSCKREWPLECALDRAMRSGVITVAAAGNQGTLGSSTITRHPWVIPVVASDLRGSPLGQSNLGSSIGRGGISAPGENIQSLGTGGKSSISGGTSVAAPFVTGAIALLWSEFPSATANQVRLSILRSRAWRRRTVVPPLLDTWTAYEVMSASARRGEFVGG
jgi:subtilisin family serine protease